MNTPRPALVTQEAARRLPRLALWLLCLAYVLPGFVGRQPWKGDDLASFGFMQAMAEGRSGWLAPQLDGLSSDVAALLPYWLGALALKATAGWLAPDVAVRLPFALMLAGTLAATWYATYNLTRLPGAQPVALAFGGEAQPRDYARALADGSLLALIATLGMAQLAHETTPALAQLCFTALVFFGFAAMPFQPRAAVAATLLGLPALALSGAPTLALAYGAAAVLAQLWPGWQAAAPANALQAGARRRLLLATLAAMLASAALGWRLGLWRWQITWPLAAAQWRSLARLFAWFTWPIWPLTLWTLWRWRAQLPRPRQQRHLGLPLMMAGMAMLAAVFTPARDRSLLAALPPLAALAALALPTLRRGMAALIDWFTVLFFSGWAIVIWVVWISLQTGVPAKPAANVARLAPGFEPVFQWPALLAALAATLAWAWLARWRTGRHRAALWKSLVLPAAGATLCWLLLMTLWLPALDYGRSLAAQVRSVAAIVGQGACVNTFALNATQLTALRFHGGWQLEPLPRFDAPATCPWLIAPLTASPSQQQWAQRLEVPRPTDKGDTLLVFARNAADGRP